MNETPHPIDGRSTSEEIGKRIIDQPDLPKEGIFTENHVFTEIVVGSGQLKRGVFRHFEVMSDEAGRIGGSDKFPPPLAYMAMGVGF